jgi:hypothetical protein
MINYTELANSASAAGPAGNDAGMSLRSRAALAAAILSGFALSAPAAAAAGSSQARGWQTVSYLGVTVSVPASWPVIDLAAALAACQRLDVHAVYLGAGGPAPDCPAGLTGVTESVRIQRVDAGAPAYRAATVPARAHGVALLTDPRTAVTHTLTDLIIRAAALVSITYRGDLGLARRIQSSIAIEPGLRAQRLPRPAPLTPAPRSRRKQGLYQGPGFDACAAPSATTMTKWLASPYRAVGVYIGGANSACAQPNLTSSWLTAIGTQGWHYFPFYVGLQSSCAFQSGLATIKTAQAAAQGKAAADDAAQQAQSLSIPAGSPIIFDMEAYAPRCDPQVVTFLSAWDSELHARGYHAAVYESFTNISALVKAGSSMTQPDVIDYADWDGVATTTSSYMPAGLWINHQRLHQYKGGHNERFGGVTINIDNDQLDVNLSGSGVPPGPPPQPGFRAAVGTSGGATELFARSAGRVLEYAWQQGNGQGFSAVGPAGRSPSNLASNPAVAATAGGGLAVFAITRAGLVANAWQDHAPPGGWVWGAPLPAPPGRPAPGTDPAAVRLPGGDLAVLVTTTTGGVAVSRQQQPGTGAWTGWSNLGGSCAGSPAVIRAGSQVVVACVTRWGTAATDAWKGSRWTGWSTAAGSPPDLAGPPALTSGPGARPELFAATSGGGIDFAWRSRGQRWSWGPPVAGGPFGVAVSGRPAAAAGPGAQAGVFARLADGQFAFSLQLAGPTPGSFTGWQPNAAPPPGGSAIGDPAGWFGQAGTPELVVLDARGHLAVSRYTAGAWTGWTELASSTL